MTPLLRDLYVVRRVHSIEDLPALVEIERAAFPEEPRLMDTYITEVLAKEGAVYVIGPMNRKPEGAMWLKKWGDAIYINTIGVLPDCRRKGHARRLIEHAILVAKLENKEKLRLHVREDNFNTINLLETIGFKVKGEVKSLFIHGVPAVEYEGDCQHLHPHRGSLS